MVFFWDPYFTSFAKKKKSIIFPQLNLIWGHFLKYTYYVKFKDLEFAKDLLFWSFFAHHKKMGLRLVWSFSMLSFKSSSVVFYIVPPQLYPSRSTLRQYSLHSRVSTVLITEYSTNCTHYRVQYLLYSLQSTVPSVLTTSVHCWEGPVRGNCPNHLAVSN